MIAPAAGWLIPGLGHLLQRRWIRGLLLMLSVFIMFFAGLGMQGKLYAFNTGDLLDMLGFIGDVGSGLLYFIGEPWTGRRQHPARHGRLRHQVHRRRRTAEYHLRGRRLPHRDRQKTMTFTLSHFTAACSSPLSPPPSSASPSATTRATCSATAPTASSSLSAE